MSDSDDTNVAPGPAAKDQPAEGGRDIDVEPADTPPDDEPDER